MAEDEDELDLINQKYSEIFEDIGVFDEMISNLPQVIGAQLRVQFGKIMGGVSLCHNKLALAARQRIDSLLSDCNYMLFDLEATRRERDEYKRRLGL